MTILEAVIKMLQELYGSDAVHEARKMAHFHRNMADVCADETQAARWEGNAILFEQAEVMLTFKGQAGQILLSLTT